MVNTIFIISVVVVGFVEWLKNILPAKIVESKYGVPVVSGIVSAVVGVGVVALSPTLGFGIERTIVNFIICVIGTVGTVQISYNVLLQTFKAVVAKLKSKYTAPEIDPDKKSDEIVDAIESKVNEAVDKALKNKS